MGFSSLLQACGNAQCIAKGRTVHGKIITSGFHPDVYTNNHLVSMYLKFDRTNDAFNVFNQMPARNLISWTALMSGYSRMGFAEEALNCLRLMFYDGFAPNCYTYVGALSACASLGAASAGKEIHGRIYRMEEELNNFVSNSLVNMYGKCGLLKSARLAFNAISEPNLISWTSLVSTYCQSGENVEALNIFLQSRKLGVTVNEFSAATVLGACATLQNLRIGTQVHSLVVKCGLGLGEFIMTALINFYAKCGELDLSYQSFSERDKPNLPAWTALIGGCAQQGKGREAIDLFQNLHSSGLKPSERTFSSVLSAFVNSVGMEIGKQLHSLIIKLGFNTFTFVANALLDFYSKHGLLEESSKTFEEMDFRDIVSWNALISGRIKSSNYDEAVELLGCMLFEGLYPNPFTYSSILSMCGDIPAIEWGKQTHCRIIKPGFDTSVFVGSALIDMYAKCGRLSNARVVFDNLSSRNLVSWNAMLVGYAQHGLGTDALELYSRMQREGVKPNDITFLGVLSACGHVGLLEEGWHHFSSMTKDHGIAPGMDHLACMVSLFARRGQMRRAYKLIKNFPIQPDKVVWRCLLSACKTHKNLALGRHAAEQILMIDPEDPSAHIMLSNMYAEAKLWNKTAQVRNIMNQKELKKDTGYSWTELRRKVYTFASGDSVHSEGSIFSEILSGLTAHLVDAGYVPDAMFSLHCE